MRTLLGIIEFFIVIKKSNSMNWINKETVKFIIIIEETINLLIVSGWNNMLINR
jgi:hypothetical protein